jgi:hypothetical protein
VEVSSGITGYRGVARIQRGGVHDEDDATERRLGEIGQGGRGAEFAVTRGIDEVVWRGWG